MQLFEVNRSDVTEIRREISHISFADLGREHHLEELIIRYPGLLNFGDFTPEDQSNTDLLIIFSQPVTWDRKRLDLLAVHKDGSLVVVEIKRDAKGARGRAEAMEFQAIRYAAASRRMTSDTVIGMFAAFLKSRQSDGDGRNFRQDAVNLLCGHLADENQRLTEDDLPKLINPAERQRIYLVAADYDEHVLAGCAWLRDHDIDISCFRLRPYTIGENLVYERERLIPPPELDDFMLDDIRQVTEGRVGTLPKPRRLTWGCDGEKEDPVDVNSWRAMLDKVVTRALREGLPVDAIPMRHHTHDEHTRKSLQAPLKLTEPPIWVDLHGSSAQIQEFTSKMLHEVRRVGKPLLLQVELVNGQALDF